MKLHKKVLPLIVAAFLPSPFAAPANLTWDINKITSGIQEGTGNWNISDQNWSGVANNKFSANDNVTFGGGGSGTTAYDITASSVTVGTITFNSGARYSIIGSGTITLNTTGAGSIAANVDAVINSPLAGTAGLNKNGAAKLTLGGANTYSGGTIINNGTLALGANDVLPSNGGVTMASGTTLVLNNTVQRSSSGNVGALTLQGSGTWTLQLNDDSPSATGDGSIRFASVSFPSSGTFKINGWTGSPFSSGTDDKIFINGTLGSQYSQAFLDNVRWYDEAGTTLLYSGARVSGGELQPVPEPINVALGIFGAAFVGINLGRRYLKKKTGANLAAAS